jgi:hypothetical protein
MNWDELGYEISKENNISFSIALGAHITLKFQLGQNVQRQVTRFVCKKWYS